MTVKIKSGKKLSAKPASKKTVKNSKTKTAKKVVKETSKKPVKKVAKKAEKKAVKKAVKKTEKPAAKKVVTKSTKPSVKAPTATIKKAAPKKTKPEVAPKSSAAKVLATAIPAVGQLAPEFALQSDNDGLVSLSKYRGKNIVLYFYPKDDTPGCTIEACSFQENAPKLDDANTVVIGVSPDSVESHAKFRNKYNLDFVLVSDPEHKLAEDYGVWVEKNMYGKKSMGVQRSTFLIDRNGCIAYVWPKVSVEGHTDAVLAQIAQL